jgi:hypothetical protein
MPDGNAGQLCLSEKVPVAGRNNPIVLPTWGFRAWLIAEASAGPRAGENMTREKRTSTPSF